jgi:hypothetical protein
MVAQPMQPRVANVVRPKRNKKKQILTIPQGQAPPPLPVQPVLAHVAAAQVSHPFSMVPLTTPTAQVTVPPLAPTGSTSFIPGTHAVAEKVKTLNRASVGSVLSTLMLLRTALFNITVLFVIMMLTLVL